MSSSTPAVPDSAFAAMLFDLLQAPLRWHLIDLGLTLGVFDRLSARPSAATLAADLGLDARRLALVLDGLCAMGALTKRAGRYGLSAEGATYLASDGPLSLRPMLAGLSWLRHSSLADLLTAPVPPPLDMGDPAFWDRAGGSLRSFHRALAVPVMVACLESLPAWPTARRFLDLGAGSDILARTLAARRADLAVTVFDLPPLAERIAATLADDGLAARIEVRAGDYNDADLGQGYDIIWASMTLYYARDLEALASRIRDALAPGGIFVSFHEGLTDERTRPEAHVVGRLATALRGQDLSFDAGRITSALERAGFIDVTSRTVETPFGPLRLEVGTRKP
ncbi:methyltransferase [Rhodospirillum rubrum]|uniref:methyltransferase domain-containing protein n=1 Tax=Rhodospirillum rubrum TaxID=1085 RepID=UPI0019048A29|nr:methyltransferase domain-containing protein [Rhodospirillum rubrum]MBK1665248.1 methyltransferase [Rhodospirillum rubrum]MBK1678161.1 methyltransferase [Rhodospirillum rubrum]